MLDQALHFVRENQTFIFLFSFGGVCLAALLYIIGNAILKSRKNKKLTSTPKIPHRPLVRIGHLVFRPHSKTFPPQPPVVTPTPTVSNPPDDERRAIQFGVPTNHPPQPMRWSLVRKVTDHHHPSHA